jgi:hypothetical protein
MIAAIAQIATTVSHEARARDTGAIVADVPDASTKAAASAPTATEGEVAIARLMAMAGDVRGAAILAPDGSLLAASGDAEAWSEACRELLAAADAGAGRPVTHAHVGTEDGEVFAVRQDAFALVAASERFALASLLFSDIRAVLRDLVRGAERRPSANGGGDA